MFQGFRIWDFRDSKIQGGFCESLPQFFDQINVCFCVCKKARVFLFFVCLRIFFFFLSFSSLSLCVLGFLCWRAKLIRVWLGFWVYIYSFSFFQFLVLITKVLNYLNTLFILMRKF